MKISAAIITFNEEKNIERCLRSLIDVVDEIVVVDSFSKDKTAEIAKNFDVKFIQNPFSGHVEQKNFAMHQCKHEYILSLDADESLSETLKESILNLKTQSSVNDAYQMNRMNNYCGKWIKNGGWYPDKKIRLWKKSVGQWGGDNPHDKVILKEGLRAYSLKGDILHYTFHTVEQHVKQIHFFSSIAARTAYKKGKKSGILSLIARPAFKFFRDYVLKGGFMDGYYGWIIARNSAFAKFLKYLYLYEIQRGKVKVD